MKITKRALLQLLREAGEATASEVVRSKPQLRDAIELFLEDMAERVPKLAELTEKRFSSVVNSVTDEVVLVLIQHLGYAAPGSTTFEGKRSTQRLSECFLPNLPYAPMPVKSLASDEFQRALKGVVEEVSHSDSENKAYNLANKLGDTLLAMDENFGLGGEDDPRMSEAYEYVFRAIERLSAIYEMRE